jgi:hypothetical protein
MHITEASSTSVFFYLTLKFYQSQIILAVSWFHYLYRKFIPPGYLSVSKYSDSLKVYLLEVV